VCDKLGYPRSLSRRPYLGISVGLAERRCAFIAMRTTLPRVIAKSGFISHTENSGLEDR
jgi:hypothetical protein